MKYAVIHRHERQHTVALMCRALKVSRSGYYDWRSRPVSQRKHDNQELTEIIKAYFLKTKKREGSPRIAQYLRKQGRKIGDNRVARLMRFAELQARAGKKYRPAAYRPHHLPAAPNLLARDFIASCPDSKWVSDITYLRTSEGWLYLAVILDLFSKKIVGWSMSATMTAKLVCDALMMAIRQRRPKARMMIHSDQGSQYCAHEYQRLLEQYGLVCSMSRKGNCWDNAVMESWNHSFKVEAIHGEPLANREATKARVFEYIEIYYNRERMHSAIGYETPEVFEMKNALLAMCP